MIDDDDTHVLPGAQGKYNVQLYLLVALCMQLTNSTQWWTVEQLSVSVFVSYFTFINLKL